MSCGSLCQPGSSPILSKVKGSLPSLRGPPRYRTRERVRVVVNQRGLRQGLFQLPALSKVRKKIVQSSPHSSPLLLASHSPAYLSYLSTPSSLHMNLATCSTRPQRPLQISVDLYSALPPLNIAQSALTLSFSMEECLTRGFHSKTPAAPLFQDHTNELFRCAT